MPVIDHPIHPTVQHDTPPAGCYSRAPGEPPLGLTFTGERYAYRMSMKCRQIGRKFNGAWVPLDECLGCQSPKDEEYIAQSRQMIDKEFA